MLRDWRIKTMNLDVFHLHLAKNLCCMSWPIFFSSHFLSSLHHLQILKINLATHMTTSYDEHSCYLKYGKCQLLSLNKVYKFKFNQTIPLFFKDLCFGLVCFAEDKSAVCCSKPAGTFNGSRRRCRVIRATAPWINAMYRKDPVTV